MAAHQQEANRRRENEKLKKTLTQEMKVRDTYKRVVDLEETSQREERETWHVERGKMFAELAVTKSKLGEAVRALKAKEGPPLNVEQPGAACDTCARRSEEMQRSARNLSEQEAGACAGEEKRRRTTEQRHLAERRSNLDVVADLRQQLASAERRAKQAELDRDNVLALVRGGRATPGEIIRKVAEMVPVAATREPTPLRGRVGLSQPCQELLLMEGDHGGVTRAVQMDDVIEAVARQ